MHWHVKYKGYTILGYTGETKCQVFLNLKYQHFKTVIGAKRAITKQGCFK
ncbi:MAG: hypothetical protein PHG08_01000 [Bacilli bacterium]|nr:hypothetical protein [Bacilli bacterium]